MKTKNIALLILALLSTSCSNHGNDDLKPSGDFYSGIYYGYKLDKTDLVWKLSKESFFSQYETAEKEDRYNFTAEAVYAHGETAINFLGGNKEIVLSFPKSNFSFNKIDTSSSMQPFFDLSNYSKIFERCDFILLCEHNLRESIDNQNNRTLFVRNTFSVPYSFSKGESIAKDCYDTYLLFYGQYASSGIKENEFIFFGSSYVPDEKGDDYDEQIKWLEEKRSRSISEESFLEVVRNTNDKFDNPGNHDDVDE